jgi:hypothetical protein
MTKKPTLETPEALFSLAQRNKVKQLRSGLSLLHAWGTRNDKYIPVLGMFLFHDDNEVLRLTLGVLRNYERRAPKAFGKLTKYLLVFHELAPTQFTALELIVALQGPRPELMPYLKKYLSRYVEETCDLIVRCGAGARELVPDLIRTLKSTNNWDEIWAAVDPLGAIGKRARPAIPILKELAAKHESGVITGRACVALERITGISRNRWPRPGGTP